MKRLFFLLLISLALSVSSFAQTTQPSSKSSKSSKGATFKKKSLTQSCDSPSFPATDKKPPDSLCGLTGSGGAEAAQNTSKNNFCASGDPEAEDFTKLKDLQTQVENASGINWGNKNTPDHKRGPTTDRAPLQAMGEDKLVLLKAFVLIARQEGAESVNCGANAPNKPVYHDIHISLVPTGDETDECNSVVAEMSPHHRPAEWTAANLMKLAKAHTPVRVTGHLFFDSSHVPCADGQPVPSNPKRFSLWEIHPIYKFEVCTGNCDGDGTYVDLVDWVNSNQ
ncbi:MAG TPA: hypothetical protein VI685_07765 [Candidatus Angelobacter sp.]